MNIFLPFGPFITNFSLKNYSTPYKGTFFAYLVQFFEFFHKDFILASLLYSQTFFCRLAHFIQIFFLHYTIRAILPFLYASYELSIKNISIPNIDTFEAFGPLIWKILQYFYTSLFFALALWLFSHSPNQTSTDKNFWLSMIIAEQSLLLGYFFILSTKLFVCVSLFVDFWNTVQSIPALLIFYF